MSDKYHDHAIACAEHLFEFIYGLLDQENEDEVFDGLYERVHATLEIFDLQSGGVQERIVPSKN